MIYKVYRGVEQSGQLAWLITTRSEVQILSPQPRKNDYRLVVVFSLRAILDFVRSSKITHSIHKVGVEWYP